MSLSTNDYHGLWRADANDAMPYSDDYSDALSLIPELIDGALGSGEASEINLAIDITNPEKCTIDVADNGKGIVSLKRLLDWTAKDSGNIGTESVYGHGSKKAMTKFMPEYTSATWKIYWRKQDKRGVSGSLNILSSPFKGLETAHTEDETNELICPEHGTHWHLEFNLSVLGKLTKPADILRSLQELCCVRYDPKFYQPYTIKLKVINGSDVKTTNSTEWKSLKECLELETLKGNVKKTHEFRETVDRTMADCSVYQIVVNGNTFASLHPEFPIFARKNMNAQRVNIARDGRYIEAMPYSKFMGKEAHNNDNGKIIFLQFISGDNLELPAPCTTKVKMQEECPIFKKMTAVIKKRILVAPEPVVKSAPPTSAPVARAVPPTPTPVTKAAPPTPTKAAQPTPTKAAQPTPVPVARAVPPAQKMPSTKKQAPIEQVPAPEPPREPASAQKPAKMESYDQIMLNQLYDKYGHTLLTNVLNEFRDYNH